MLWYYNARGMGACVQKTRSRLLNANEATDIELVYYHIPCDNDFGGKIHGVCWSVLSSTLNQYFHLFCFSNRQQRSVHRS